MYYVNFEDGLGTVPLAALADPQTLRLRLICAWFVLWRKEMISSPFSEEAVFSLQIVNSERFFTKGPSGGGDSSDVILI